MKNANTGGRFIERRNENVTRRVNYCTHKKGERLRARERCEKVENVT